MLHITPPGACPAVVLLAEDVDRNDDYVKTFKEADPVVLLAEDVDRNEKLSRDMRLGYEVVLLAEDVDRNAMLAGDVETTSGSSSSRRTWIEIPESGYTNGGRWMSSSSRRTWIEIARPTPDRAFPRRRPPRGGRG